MQTIAPLWLWIVFVAFVLAALFVDFVVLKKQGAHEVGVKEALYWSVIWVALSFVFNGLFWWAVRDTTGSLEVANEKSLEFLTGYLIEKSLAVDNIFVFLMIFTYFAVPAAYQKRVLMIGIIGAIVLRTVMILIGGWLIAALPLDAVRVRRRSCCSPASRCGGGRQGADLDDNPALKICCAGHAGEQALRRRALLDRRERQAHRHALFMVICMVGLTDVIFAVDSIPAIFAITSDPFIVLTSNVFAILGLRAMFFLLQAVADQVPPAQLRPGGDPGVHRHQDDADRRLQDPGGGVARGGGGDPGDHHGDQRAQQQRADSQALRAMACRGRVC
jgi:tellurite resistance protein TerC